ncbi:DEAD/DEAH box helicase [Crassaminicella profunda]|uniref:DEAD/DEAH box helicase family protein n=1 Tax=Crassaminicella profunda TaxID=1286698 RepID=UPI0024848565|nr:DEAD/DEAH box helicase [Crassaminicella profunda]
MGELRPQQSEAAEKLYAYNTGILSATTAFGKTVVAAWLIGNKKVNTLIIVHRKQLMEQWKERLQTFLDVDAKQMGQIGGGKRKRTGIVDIAIIQSINYKGKVKDYVEEYGMVIVDECHHISSYSFEQVLKQVKAKYVYGLTATPIRKDGHHPIVMMQCGNIRHKVTAKSNMVLNCFEHIVVPRYHELNIKENVESKPSIHSLYKGIIEDKKRNDMIVEDVLEALKQKRSPIILTERTAYVEYFERRLEGAVKNIIVLRGGLGKKKLKDIKDKMDQISEEEERIIIATGKYVGEGFDDARLDTLFLTMPISWKGTLQQYAGRLHRQYDSKEVVKIFDYVDKNIPMFMRMYERRLKGYKSMGYDIKEEL